MEERMGEGGWAEVYPVMGVELEDSVAVDGTS
jgi:hypothetical protein